jgi:hypothetical protein
MSVLIEYTRLPPLGDHVGRQMFRLMCYGQVLLSPLIDQQDLVCFYNEITFNPFAPDFPEDLLPKHKKS